MLKEINIPMTESFGSLKKIDLDTITTSKTIIDNTQKNTRKMILSVFQNSYQIEFSDIGEAPPLKKLIIERQTGSIWEAEYSLPDDRKSQMSFISAFLGIIYIFDKAFLVIVEEVSQTINMENHEIFQVCSVDFKPLENENEVYASNKDIFNHINNLKKLFSFGFYYSFTYDLTLSKMKKANQGTSDLSFCWNGFLIKDMISKNIHSKWQIKMVQGHINAFSTHVLGKELFFYLISRRSCYKAGTRFKARGIDDDGNVANFVETEQIMYYHLYCCSHVQIRGSVPIFWLQEGITAKTKVTRTTEMTMVAFLKHMDMIKKNYSKSMCINLMTKAKPHEQLLTEKFEDLVKKTNLEYIRYEYFDFHSACKGRNFQRLNPFVKKINTIVEAFKYYAENTSNRKVLSNQTGVFRINCLDCLDRTNVLMSKIAIRVFEMQMRHMNVDLIATFGPDLLDQLDNVNNKQQHSFIQCFKNVWADNGDYISKLYAGTGSTTSSVTRNGKGTLFGLIDQGMKSIGRFYYGNFEDQQKQNSIDLLLGQHTDTGYVDSLAMELRDREKEFAKYEPFSIFLCTWNIGASAPSPTMNFSKELFNFEGLNSPDLVVVGFQELVDLNARNVVVASNLVVIAQWQEILLKSLLTLDKTYSPIKEINLVGIQLYVFLKEKYTKRVTSLETDTVKCGFGNKLGNKGAVILKISIDDTSIGIINAHLEAGQKKNLERLTNIKDIHERAFQQEGMGRKKLEKIQTFNYKFLIGDLNFRVDLPNEDAREKIEHIKKKHVASILLMKDLLESDQLIKTKNSNEYLSRYNEAQITFLPTYKYDKFSSEYDTSKKQRVPAWCDRILLWEEDSCVVKQKFYARRELNQSDHRPVCAYFGLEVKTIDKEKKKAIWKSLCEEKAAKLELDTDPDFYNDSEMIIEGNEKNLIEMDDDADIEPAMYTTESNPPTSGDQKFVLIQPSLL